MDCERLPVATASAPIKDDRADPHATGPVPAGPWLLVQRAGLLGVAVLVVALLAWPRPTLTVFWNGVVPLLPAVFLIHPGLWRNVCPLATVGMGPAETGLGPRVGERYVAWAGPVGIVLLASLVPARRFLLNEHAPALALFLVAVTLLAWTTGRLLPRKAGFCNAFCPVLPVERLYGQRPLTGVPNPRCPDCNACSAVGCLDLAPEKIVARTVGPLRKTREWTFTAFGVFAAAFPGFVAGYFLTRNVPPAHALSVYATVWGSAGASWVVVTMLVWATGVRAGRLAPLLAGAAVGTYYWFAVPGLLELVPGAVEAVPPTRAGALLLVGAWTTRAVRFRPPRPWIPGPVDASHGPPRSTSSTES